MTNGPDRSHPPVLPNPVPSSWSAELFGQGSSRVSATWLSKPRVGEVENGDAVLVRTTTAGVLVSVVDALGHGPKAAEVSRKACEYLAETTDVTAHGIVHGLHRSLHGTRGAAALVLHITKTKLEVCSVGNVELRSTNPKLPFILTPGVLGLRLRQPKTSEADVTPHRYVLFTDGISGRFDLKTLPIQPSEALVTHIFGTHRHTHDDASVVVVELS